MPTEEIAPQKSVATLCAACGASFSCGADAGECWCFAVVVATETLAAIGEKYDACLCRRCLESPSDSASSQQSRNKSDEKNRD